MVEYTHRLDKIDSSMLDGFFVDWPNPPSKEKHFEILKGSTHVWLAIDSDANRIVGFITALSDGVISAYIPLLEVLPEYQRQGIGAELVNRMLKTLNHLYMIDLLCDEELQEYYERFGLHHAQGMFIRNYRRQNCE